MLQLRQFLRFDMTVYLVLLAYVTLVVSVINWGLPTTGRVFTYHMDEWHQLMAVKSIASEGTNNTAGAANGPMLPFLLAGAWFAPFYFLGIVDPSAILSPVTQLDQQAQIFMIGRVLTLIFGVLSVVLVAATVRRLRLPVLVGVLFFTFSPAWIQLSNYFKYDIMLLFFVLLFIFFAVRTLQNSDKKWLLLTGVSMGVAMCIKLSAIPLVPLYGVVFLLARLKHKATWDTFWIGGLCSVIVFMLLGIPDVLMGLGTDVYKEFLTSNLISNPQSSDQYATESSVWWYLFTDQFPLVLGYGLAVFFAVGGVYYLVSIVDEVKGKRLSESISEYSVQLFLMVGFVISLASILPLQLFATANRALILLPWMALLATYWYSYLVAEARGKYRFVPLILVMLVVGVQMVQTLSWQYLKLQTDTRQLASLWIRQTIPQRAVIGIQGPPIYRRLPDGVVTEYYAKQQFPDMRTNYHYLVLDENSGLAPYVVLTRQELLHADATAEQQLLTTQLALSGFEPQATFLPRLGTLRWFASETSVYRANLVPVTDITVWMQVRRVDDVK